PVADVVSIDGGDSRGTGADSLGNLVAIRIPTERGSARQRAQVVERGEPIEVVKDPLRVRKDRPAGVLLRLPGSVADGVVAVGYHSPGREAGVDRIRDGLQTVQVVVGVRRGLDRTVGLDLAPAVAVGIVCVDVRGDRSGPLSVGQ